MTLNIQLITLSARPIALILLLGVLAACSSKPSPWSAKSSPWGEQSETNQQAADEPAMIEDMDGPVGIAGIDEAPMIEVDFTDR